MADAKEQFDAYVICSTLNQVVNYIPYKFFDINKDDIYFITIGDKNEYKKLAEEEITFSANRRFNNYEWDKNLKEVIGLEKGNTTNTLFISEENIYNMKEIKKLIEKFLAECIEKNRSKVLWNITGGQRSISLVIKEIYEKRKKEKYDDKIMYLEGNTNQMIVYNYVEDETTDKWNYEYQSTKYELSLKDINIKTALALAGFKDYKDNKYINYLEQEEEINFEQKIFTKLYEEIRSNFDLRDELVSLNKKKKLFFTKREEFVDKKAPKKKNDEENKKERSEARKEFFQKFLNKEIETEDKYNELFKFVEDFKDEKGQVIDYLVKNFGADVSVFGRIFEYICLYGIKKEIQKINNDKNNSFFIDLSLSRKVGFFEDKRYSSDVDEIDIILLSASGQIISFECKSGGMDGNNAKSHNYTTYALAGVYGMPILLIPLAKEEILKESKMSDERKNLLKESFNAISSAKKANVKVWGIDQIDVKLQEIVDMANVNKEEGNK